MIEAIGWLALALAGGHAIFALVALLVTGMGLKGIEAAPRALAIGGLAAAGWIYGVAYFSPLSVNWADSPAPAQDEDHTP